MKRLPSGMLAFIRSNETARTAVSMMMYHKKRSGGFRVEVREPRRIPKGEIAGRKAKVNDA